MTEDICPSCLEKLNYFEKVKIKSDSGKKKVNQCPKCAGYFEASVPYSLFWSALPMFPLIVIFLVPKKYEALEIWAVLVAVLVCVPVFFWKEKKRKDVIKEKGYWVAIGTSNN